ncbi:Gfo/Idh/MocA family protein [Oleiharenicola lentus]|uniref:Gfo/Idh/MocA family protein n=1 Tax=Oleiharenicola lentus TaxID=2508720 RepID=UPI003F678CC4
MSSSPLSSSAPLRTALIGLGRIGFGYHAPAIVNHPAFNLVGVADPLPERRAEATANWQAPGFDSVETMLREKRPDVVVIASPTTLHQEHTAAAFAHGAHVLCDKPVARSVAEFDTMVAAGAAAGRKFLAYQPNRIKAELRTLRDILAQNLLGPIHAIKRANSSFTRRADWQAFRANGGGMLNNYASHQLDEMLALTGHAPVRSVFCHTRCVATAGDAEDFVKIVLVTEGGVLIDVDITQAAAQPVTAWQVFGSRGAATWDAPAHVWRVLYYVPEEAPLLNAQQGLAAAGRKYAHEELPWRELTVPADATSDPDYYDLAWRHFALGEPAPVTTDEIRQLLQLIERCRTSDSTGNLA